MGMWLDVGAAARAFPRQQAALLMTASASRSRSLLLRYHSPETLRQIINICNFTYVLQRNYVITIAIAIASQDQCSNQSPAVKTECGKAYRPSYVRCARHKPHWAPQFDRNTRNALPRPTISKQLLSGEIYAILPVLHTSSTLLRMECAHSGADVVVLTNGRKNPTTCICGLSSESQHQHWGART